MGTVLPATHTKVRRTEKGEDGKWREIQTKSELEKIW